MYNGIGLLTARGSGTSGYVQTSKFNLRGGPPQRFQPGRDLDASSGPTKARADPSILEHKAKREIELRVAEEQARLEDIGMSDEQIASTIADFRMVVMQEVAEKQQQQQQAQLDKETHAMAARKEEHMKKLSDAFGVRPDEIREGDAFDRELQEKKKQEAIEARENKEIERAKRERQREREKKRADKERKKREKERKKEEEARAKRAAEVRAEWAARQAAPRDRYLRGHDARDGDQWNEQRDYNGRADSRHYGDDRWMGGGNRGRYEDRYDSRDRRPYRRDNSPDRYQPSYSPSRDSRDASPRRPAEAPHWRSDRDTDRDRERERDSRGERDDRGRRRDEDSREDERGVRQERGSREAVPGPSSRGGGASEQEQSRKSKGRKSPSPSSSSSSGSDTSGSSSSGSGSDSSSSDGSESSSSSGSDSGGSSDRGGRGKDAKRGRSRQQSAEPAKRRRHDSP